ncbi:zinc-binding alcohol dehydrogenase family protein [Enterocloster citroniae]|uniref:zinc-binding alcohol dehydrogenase family protein n=1 Tax=Enterocloster citroniae TaxID=358743 RepID=UPI001A9C1727|nr:zinc-binding alcohol dehydrogenase family protein [Enterocloster citroniae]
MIKAIKFEKPWDVACVEKEMPVPKKGEALIRVRSAGICGSDIGAYRGTNPLVSYPRVIGHEIAGEIISISEDNRGQLKPGDHVIVDPYLYCGHCYLCSIGRTNCCTDLKVLGVHAEGGMAEYFVHPESMLVRLPDDMPWDLAPIAEPLTIALHGIHRGGLKAGEYAAIIGAGPIGMLAAMTALAYGAEPIMIDLVEERLLQAKQLGVRYTIDLRKENAEEKVREYTGGNMAHLVMECSGANAAVRSTLDLVCNAGRITLTGWPKNETPLPTDVITKKEVDIRGARTSANEFEEAIRLIHSGQVDARQILTKTVSLDEAADTIRDIEKNPGNYMKVNVMI